MLKIASKSRTTLASTPQSTVEVNKQNLLTWDHMFVNFPTQSRNQLCKTPAATSRFNQNDPIEVTSPLHQPNIFQFNEKLRLGFREYLSGEKTALNLVNECNKTNRKDPKLKNKIRLFKKANMFANQLQQGNKYKMFHQQGLTDAEIEKKIKVFQRFEKIKRIIQRKQQDNSAEEQNFKDVQLFRQLYEVSEENKNKIKQRDLMIEHATGKREFENVRYSTHGQLRVKKTNYQRQRGLTASCERKSFVKQKVRDQMEEKLQTLLDKKAQQEKDMLCKAKRQMQMKNNKYNQFENEKYLLNDPLNKDVRLYAYMFMKPREKQIKTEESETRCLTARNETRTMHMLNNFNNQLTSRKASMSDDSSLNSMLEINIDNLYRASNAIQNQIMNGDSEKFVKRIKQFQRVQQLNSEIIRVNQQKLSSERKLLLS